MTIRWYFKACVIVWMMVCVMVYFVVTVSPEGSLAPMLPDFVWRLRAAVLPWFYSEAVMH